MGILMVVLAFCLALMIVAVVYQRAAAARDARDFPPPGRVLETQNGRLHIQIAGAGSPVVIFEAGMASSSLSWSLVQPAIANITQTVSYDRFGLGWSDAVADRREIEDVVSEMHALLEQAGVVGSRILVGHSYGGLIVRAYAARYPGEVAGLVLVDPVSAREWCDPDEPHRVMLRNGIVVSRFCAVLVRLGIVRVLMKQWSAVEKILPKHKNKPGKNAHGVSGLDRIVGEAKKLPPEIWPMVQAHWCEPKCFDGMSRYFAAFPGSAAAVADRELKDVPLIVLSAGNAGALQRAEHVELGSSERSRMEIVEDSGHWIQFDRPDVVIRAVGEMVARVGKGFDH